MHVVIISPQYEITDNIQVVVAIESESLFVVN